MKGIMNRGVITQQIEKDWTSYFVSLAQDTTWSLKASIMYTFLTGCVIFQQRTS